MPIFTLHAPFFVFIFAPVIFILSFSLSFLFLYLSFTFSPYLSSSISYFFPQVTSADIPLPRRRDGIFSKTYTLYVSGLPSLNVLFCLFEEGLDVDGLVARVSAMTQLNLPKLIICCSNFLV
jgi:hypothetical protein